MCTMYIKKKNKPINLIISPEVHLKQRGHGVRVPCRRGRAEVGRGAGVEGGPQALRQARAPRQAVHAVHRAAGFYGAGALY